MTVSGKYKNPAIFIIMAFSLFAPVAYIWQNQYKNTVEAEISENTTAIKVIYPSQYSDTHITTNAVTSLKEFRDITFVDSETNRENLANILNAVSTVNERRVDMRLEKGTWLWTPVLDITPAYRDMIISGAVKNGITNIYLSIDTYLDIFVMPSGKEKDAKQKAFDKILEDFVKTAHKNNITVDAEAGWRNWAEIGNAYKAIAVMDYAMQFNRTHTEKLRGFQYDIEPYLLDEYKKDKKTVLQNFLDLVNNTVVRMDASDLVLSVVIPEFYDGTFKETPKFSYAGKTGYAVDHLLRILDQRINSKVIVMSYRNFSVGENGTIEISKNEIEAADTHQTKIVIAQETGDVQPPYVTFHGMSRTYYDSQVSLVQQAFAGNKNYAGTATHYVNAFLEL